MTEMRPTQGPMAPSDDSLFPTTQAVEGEVIAPEGSVVAAVEDTRAAGLELKVRSQWSYARMRFFRHRLAMVGLLGLVVIFGAGIFAGTVAPYSYAAISTALGIPVEFIGLLRARCLERIRESRALLGLADIGGNRPGGDPGA